MPTLALILQRTAAAYGMEVTAFHRSQSKIVLEARCVFAWIAADLAGHSPARIGHAIGVPARTAGSYIDSVYAQRRNSADLCRRIDRLAVEICAEALASARLKLPLPADPDPADTAARLLAGGATAATVSEDALRGLALAFLALAAGDPSTPIQQASNHG